MSDPLYLIAHKVRGEPAFDIAIHMVCPHCEGQAGGEYISCNACDDVGHWWIIPTSGHRAYPWWHLPLQFDDSGLIMDHNPKLHWTIFEMPPDLRDHYVSEREVATDLTKLFAHIHKPLAPIKRRF